ncbi:MAG: aminotransferase class III-fold pyridoxal phosphate-dependent enzyme [Streptosporangiales bacterium]|nr:aminotransferase class III-fold pyridoxal phosphate-dependent enzyme [Streptosporangiales bacterium]
MTADTNPSERTEATLVDRARSVLPGGITRSTVFVPPHPPYAVAGEGAWIVDDTGHRVLDANGNYTTLIHGHARPEIVHAATAALQNGSAFGLPTRSEVALAEMLRERTNMEQWRFCNSGSEAVMMLLRAARAATKRSKIIRFRGSYHGTSPDAVGNESHGDVIVVDQGDTEAVANALTTHGDDVAGVVIDLMPNRAGLRRADAAHVQELRSLTREHGALLLVDEVITFRLGVGGLLEQYDVEADLVSLGKAIGGGFAVGAIGGRRELLQPFDPREQKQPSAVSWGGTFSANPVTMAAGKVALDLFDATSVASLNAAGDALRARLVAAGVPATGWGSLLRLHTSDNQQAWWSLYERGVLAGTNCLLALSTAMGEEDVEHLADAILAMADEHPQYFQ